jgi:hypothetical protein
MESPRPTGTLLDEVFRTVDGQTIEVGRESWRLHVYAVHYADDRIWVQLAAMGTPNFLVTLRLPADADSDSPISIITRYLEQPERDHDDVVEVTALPRWAALTTGAPLIH